MAFARNMVVQRSRALTDMDAETRFFFVHVMKTGGSTFSRHIGANFPWEQRYPSVDVAPEDRKHQYQTPRELDAIPPERRREIRVYSGHFPFVTHTLVEADVTLTLLRDPVDRTVACLRHFKRHSKQHQHLSLEEIYDDPWLHAMFMKDYQAKLFAMTPDERFEGHLFGVDVDANRLRVAKAHLAQVDVIGLSDRFDEFLDELRERFGWRIGEVPDERVSNEGWDVPRSFRLRIAAENPADVAFYEHAVELYEQRARDRGCTTHTASSVRRAEK